MPREYKLIIKMEAESQAADFKPEPDSFVLIKKADGWEFYYVTLTSEQYSIDSSKVVTPSGQKLSVALEAKEIGALNNAALIEIIKAARESWIIRSLDNILVAAKSQLLRYKDREDLPNCNKFKTLEKQGPDHLRHRLSEYEKNVSQALDYFIFILFDIIAAKAMNGEISLTSINSYLESSGANHAARYMGAGRVPHITSDLLFQKMLWIEWTLKAVKELRNKDILDYGWTSNIALDRFILNPRISFTCDQLDAYVKKPGKEYLQSLLTAFRASYHVSGMDASFELARQVIEEIDTIIQSKQAKSAADLAASSSAVSTLASGGPAAGLSADSAIELELEKLWTALNQENERLMSTTGALRDAQLRDTAPGVLSRAYGLFRGLVSSGKEDEADDVKMEIKGLQTAVETALEKAGVIEKQIQNLRLQKMRDELKAQLTRAKERYTYLLDVYSKKSQAILALDPSFQFTISQFLQDKSEENAVSAKSPIRGTEQNAASAGPSVRDVPVHPLLLEINKIKQELVHINQETGLKATAIAEMDAELPAVSKRLADHIDLCLEEVRQAIIAWEGRLAKSFKGIFYPNDPAKAQYIKRLLNSRDREKIIYELSLFIKTGTINDSRTASPATVVFKEIGTLHSAISAVFDLKNNGNNKSQADIAQAIRAKFFDVRAKDMDVAPSPAATAASAPVKRR